MLQVFHHREVTWELGRGKGWGRTIGTARAEAAGEGGRMLRVWSRGWGLEVAWERHLNWPDQLQSRKLTFSGLNNCVGSQRKKKTEKSICIHTLQICIVIKQNGAPNNYQSILDECTLPCSAIAFLEFFSSLIHWATKYQVLISLKNIYPILKQVKHLWVKSMWTTQAEEKQKMISK
jgi:hypothetical protein